MPNFVKISQSIAEVLQFFDFSRLPPPSWRLRRDTVPNFIKIAQFIAEILRFFLFFKTAVAAILNSGIHEI